MSASLSSRQLLIEAINPGRNASVTSYRSAAVLPSSKRCSRERRQNMLTLRIVAATPHATRDWVSTSMHRRGIDARSAAKRVRGSAIFEGCIQQRQHRHADFRVVVRAQRSRKYVDRCAQAACRSKVVEPTVRTTWSKSCKGHPAFNDLMSTASLPAPKMLS